MASQKLTADRLLSLEEYARKRASFRQQAIIEKKRRQIVIGEHVRLFFENRATIKYQVQEVLRVEKTFEQAGIAEELEAYNPLIPDGDNFKVTMMIEYDDVAQRRRELKRLVGIEDRVWLRVGDHEPVFAIADEDMERSTQEKTSAVHFLRFQLNKDQCAAVRSGASLAAGVDHEQYRHSVEPLPEALTQALREDIE